MPIILLDKCVTAEGLGMAACRAWVRLMTRLGGVHAVDAEGSDSSNDDRAAVTKRRPPVLRKRLGDVMMSLWLVMGYHTTKYDNSLLQRRSETQVPQAIRIDGIERACRCAPR